MLAHTLKSDSFKRINIFLQFVYVPQEISDEYTLRITHVEIQPYFTFKLFFFLFAIIALSHFSTSYSSSKSFHVPIIDLFQIFREFLLLLHVCIHIHLFS